MNTKLVSSTLSLALIGTLAACGNTQSNEVHQSIGASHGHSGSVVVTPSASGTPVTTSSTSRGSTNESPAKPSGPALPPVTTLTPSPAQSTTVASPPIFVPRIREAITQMQTTKALVNLPTPLPLFAPIGNSFGDTQPGITFSNVGITTGYLTLQPEGETSVITEYQMSFYDPKGTLVPPVNAPSTISQDGLYSIAEYEVLTPVSLTRTPPSGSTATPEVFDGINGTLYSSSQEQELMWNDLGWAFSVTYYVLESPKVNVSMLETAATNIMAGLSGHPLPAPQGTIHYSNMLNQYAISWEDSSVEVSAQGNTFPEAVGLANSLKPYTP